MKELKIRGRAIRSDQNGLICLNDIWSAAGFTKNQKPPQWLRLPTAKSLALAILNKDGKLGKSQLGGKIRASSVYYTKVGTGGGSFADIRLALAYAEYLSPKLALEVREVYLRYKAAHPTLADEVLERASDEANLWVARRAQSRVVRNSFTKVLQNHGVTGYGYSACTDEGYQELFDKKAAQIRVELNLPKKTNVRDHLDLVGLSQVMLTEALSAERIEEENSQGNSACKTATGRVAMHVRAAVGRSTSEGK
jgi:hypothetical protein